MSDTTKSVSAQERLVEYAEAFKKEFGDQGWLMSSVAWTTGHSVEQLVGEYFSQLIPHMLPGKRTMFVVVDHTNEDGPKLYYTGNMDQQQMVLAATDAVVSLVMRARDEKLMAAPAGTDTPQ